MSEPVEPGVVEAVASLLARYGASPTPEQLDLWMRVCASLSTPGPDDLQQSIASVVVTNALVEADALCWMRDGWVSDVQARAQELFLLVVRQSQESSSVGLEEWLLTIGAALAGIVVPAAPQRASLIARVTARLANLAGDVTVAVELYRKSRLIEWSPDARADVVSALLELVSEGHTLPDDLDLGDLRDEADGLRATDTLDAAALAQLERAVGAQTVADPEAERLTRTFGALFGVGDYRGAAIVARRVAERTNPRLVLLGTNLATLCELHDGSLDDPAVAGAEVARLRYLASLPESEALERSSPLASPAALLRELVAHQLGVGESANTAVAAAAAEALSDSRVARVTASAATSLLDQLARMAAATRGTVEFPALLQPETGTRVHVADLVLTADQAALAVVETRRTESVGRVCSMFGVELRLLTKLVSSPRHAERLTDREIGRLRRCLGFHTGDRNHVTVVPTARLWTMPWERIIPGAHVDMCTSPVRPGSARPAGWRLTVVAVADPELPGGQAELDALRVLQREGSIELHEASSLSHFATLLDDKSPELAAIGLHGAGEGLSYRLLRGNEALPVHRLLEIQLPPLVSVASCHSGSISGAVNLAAALTRSRGAAVVSLWDTLDSGASKVMSSVYRSLAAGGSPVEAWRPTAEVAAKLGLRLIGAN